LFALAGVHLLPILTLAMFPLAQLVNRSNNDKIDNIFMIIELIEKSGFCLA
jgi:hypothetical protein